MELKRQLPLGAACGKVELEIWDSFNPDAEVKR
jgi:hypothetical protein